MTGAKLAQHSVLNAGFYLLLPFKNLSGSHFDTFNSSTLVVAVFPLLCGNFFFFGIFFAEIRTG